jgi:hypothetical protein
MKNAIPQPLHPEFIADDDRHGAVVIRGARAGSPSDAWAKAFRNGGC